MSNLIPALLRREARITCSLRAQPLRFRILKWTAILAGMIAFHDRFWFWRAFAGLVVAALTVHLLYRWKTRGWTRPWGGWNDLETANKK